MALTYITLPRILAESEPPPSSAKSLQRVEVALERTPGFLAFLVMVVLGMGVMRLLTLASAISVAELVLSGSFSVLVLSFVVLERQQAVSYFFGAIVGFLAYIVLFGFPAL